MVTAGGEFLRQEPNPDHPTGAALCVKGKAAHEIVYSAQRQLYPLRRTKPKGEADPGWVQISWDEALEWTAKALDHIRCSSGPEAVAFGLTTPSGTPISDNIFWISRFIHAFGSPNVADGTEICNWHKDWAHAYTFGRSISSPDFANAGCIVLWGHNPSATWLSHATATAGAKSRGAHLVVIDPRRTGFASRADQWLRVRPGADGALALGIAHQMIKTRQFDVEFMQRWSNGPLLVRDDTGHFLRAKDLADPPHISDPSDLIAIAASSSIPIAYSTVKRAYQGDAVPALDSEIEVTLASHDRIHCKTAFRLYSELCAQFPPERVAQICWIEQERVIETARILFESKPVCYYAWSGVGQHTNATQTDRAISLLMALTGSFDLPGGNVAFAKPPSNDVSGAELLPASQLQKCISLQHSSLGPGRQGSIGSDALYKAITESEPYQVRAMVNFGRNFLLTHAGVDRGARALTQLEFFVHADVVLTPTASFADIFLPINTPWEREALRVGFESSAEAHQLVQLRRAAIPSCGESRSDAFVVFELAQRLGFGNHFWNGDLEAGLNHILQPLDITLEDLRSRPEGISFPCTTQYQRYKTEGFSTPTGKLEIYSEAFLDGGENPLPAFVEPAHSPVTSSNRRFPLVLTSAKMPQYTHASGRHIPSLRKRVSEPEVIIHPDTAADRGIKNGDQVVIKTKDASIRMRARLDPTLDPRVIVGQYGWWQSNEALKLAGSDPLSAKGANYNRVIADDQTDPISGSQPLRSYLCEVRLVEPK
jgi:anaerobic selenocysteine-containing dehydrogenase